MVARVKQPFIDRFTNQFHKEGELLRVSAERCAELAALGFVIAEETAEEKPKRRRAAKKV